MAPDASLLEDLFGRVEAMSNTLVDSADAADATGALPSEAVKALDASELVRMALPRELGGWEAPMVTQLLVIEELTAVEASCGWVTSISNDAIGLFGAFLPEAGLGQVFDKANGFPRGAIAAVPTGVATPCSGGYRVTGRWRFASGILHADWVGVHAIVDPETRQRVLLAVPVGAVTIHSTWNVLGLKGTGSCDFSLDDVFVPEALSCSVPMTFFLAGPVSFSADGSPKAHRGGPMFQLPWDARAVWEHTAFALGMGRGALRELRALLRQRSAAAPEVPEREVVLNALSMATIEMDATRQLALDYLTRLQADAGCDLSARLLAEGKALAAHATRVGRSCTEMAFRYGGSSALYSPNRIERFLRDMHAASIHVLTSDRFFGPHGATLVDEKPADGFAHQG